MYNILFKCPFTMIISGGTMSGKTTFTYNFLQYKEELFTKKPFKVFLFYKKHQPMYDQMIKYNLVDELIELDDGMIKVSEFQEKVRPFKNKGGTLCIFDDLMEQVDGNSSEIFTKEAHHENCSVIFMTQMLFLDKPHYRAMSRSCMYFVAMKNPRDAKSIENFATQICSNKGILLDVYKEATKNAYSYLLMDFHPTTPDHVRLRSRILPNERPVKVFMEKNCI